jgi:capsular exopolysaccharide synthesis family protein
VARQQALVQASERALADYESRLGAGAIGQGQNIVTSRLAQLNDAVTKARTERIAKENLWNQIRQAGQDADTILSVLQNPAVQNLRQRVSELERERARISERYGEKHPDYQKVIAQLADANRQYDLELKRAVQTAKNEYDAAVAQERTLLQALNEQKAAASELSRQGVDYTVLQREAESNRQVYNQLLTRQNELRVIANSRTNNVRLVERARVPGGPFTPNHQQDWIFALVLGLGLAIATAFGLDYLDDTVKTPEDVTRRLKLRFLGLVPAVRGERHPLLSGPVPHDFGEAFRSLRTSLVAQFGGEGARTMVVTSAQPLEGKTTTAVNLAMALAVGGSRVLLIDADMRRPNVHKALRIGNDRGLSQLLAGQARMREVVQRTHDPNLLVITAGRTPANPSELLASDRMRALLVGLETGPFDWVVIDTPPVLAVTDAAILAPLVAGVTFVIGSEMTRWRLAERAVETVMASNPRLLCAVLNRVDFARNKYYYSRYYGHQYKSYYSEAPAA